MECCVWRVAVLYLIYLGIIGGVGVEEKLAHLSGVESTIYSIE